MSISIIAEKGRVSAFAPKIYKELPQEIILKSIIKRMIDYNTFLTYHPGTQNRLVLMHVQYVIDRLRVFTCLQYKSFENNMAKGEIARNEQFLLFPQCFLPPLDDFLPFSSNIKLLPANSSGLEESKICRLGKG